MDALRVRFHCDIFDVCTRTSKIFSLFQPQKLPFRGHYRSHDLGEISSSITRRLVMILRVKQQEDSPWYWYILEGIFIGRTTYFPKPWEILHMPSYHEWWFPDLIKNADAMRNVISHNATLNLNHNTSIVQPALQTLTAEVIKSFSSSPRTPLPHWSW